MLIITFDHRVGQRSGKSKHFEEDLEGFKLRP